MSSFEKINYTLRPSKQVERKLLIEALHKLPKAGYHIQDYVYLGLGSIYYADFVLFHKYLLIDEMICAEKDAIPKRMEFNKPYESIKLFMHPVGELLPRLDRARRHLVWLDYDSSLDEEVFQDIRSCIHVLAPGSILLVTVPADPRSLRELLDPEDEKRLTDDDRKKEEAKRLNELIRPHIGREVTLRDLSGTSLPNVYAAALQGFIDFCIDSRPGFDFFQLFNFSYADNLRMLSFGGIIDKADAAANLQDSGIYDLNCVNRTASPLKISVPPLTLREKLWLERNVANNPNPPEIPFETSQELVDDFAKYYRHYPTYYETLI